MSKLPMRLTIEHIKELNDIGTAVRINPAFLYKYLSESNFCKDLQGQVEVYLSDKQLRNDALVIAARAVGNIKGIEVVHMSGRDLPLIWVNEVVRLACKCQSLKNIYFSAQTLSGIKMSEINIPAGHMLSILAEDFILQVPDDINEPNELPLLLAVTLNLMGVMEDENGRWPPVAYTINNFGFSHPNIQIDGSKVFLAGEMDF